MFKKRSPSQMVEYLRRRSVLDAGHKQLILSVEDAFVNFLETSVGSLELQPMGSYQRHLVHCLADYFRLDHESVGEGDGRHLKLMRNNRSRIPGILVRDHLLSSEEEEDDDDEEEYEDENEEDDEGEEDGNEEEDYQDVDMDSDMDTGAGKDTKHKGRNFDLICRYNGQMITQASGQSEYVGGETKLRQCSTTTTYEDFVKILEEVSAVDPSKTKVFFRFSLYGFGCKIDSVSDYKSIMEKQINKPSEYVIVWIFKDDNNLVKEEFVGFESKPQVIKVEATEEMVDDKSWLKL